jgi:uncharacterized membrane protein YdjX (TVP38/TMEM64 family)
MKRNLFKLFGLLIVLAVLFGIFERYHLWVYLSLDGFNRYHDQILHFERHHIVEFTLIYIVSYIVLIACCIPGTILFDLLAGFIYGPVIGSLLVIFCYLSGALINFSLVRFLLYDLMHKRFCHLRSVIFKDNNIRSAAINLIGLRFIPVIPFWLLNILAAVVRIPFSIFALTTFIGIIPTSVIYVMIGNGVRYQLQYHQPLTAQSLANPRLLLPLVLLGLLIVIPNIIKGYRKRHSQELNSQQTHE